MTNADPINGNHPYPRQVQGCARAFNPNACAFNLNRYRRGGF
jgi:hypothetical protein